MPGPLTNSTITESTSSPNSASETANIAHHMRGAGKRVGMVTTSRVTRR